MDVMGKRITGALFCVAAAVLLAIDHLAVCTLISGGMGTYDYLFPQHGIPLLVVSLLFLGAGLFYLIWAEWEVYRRWKDSNPPPDPWEICYKQSDSDPPAP